MARAQCLGQLGSVSLQWLQDGLRDGADETELREKLDEAVNYYEQALVLDPPDAITNLARTHNQLGIAYGFSPTEQRKSIEHFKNAIGYFDRAGEWFESAGARLSVAQILLRQEPDSRKLGSMRGKR